MNRLSLSSVPALVVGCFMALSAATAKERKLTTWSEASMATWWKKNAGPADWLREREWLHGALIEAQVNHGYKKAFTNEHFKQWLIHRLWLSCFPEEWESHAFFRQEASRKAFVGLARNLRMRELFVSSLSVEDDVPKALEILCSIYRDHPKDCLEFSELAVALAVVFDQSFPEAWPHPFTKKERVAAGDLDPSKRFAWYVAGSRKKGVHLTDLSKMTVRELTFVVSTELSFKELEYVQQIKLAGAMRLAQLYPQVKYVQSRIDQGKYIWPHATYRLIDIGRKGGICADQAFFVEQTGKAKGVPTVLFVGQGRSGGHAWVGYADSRGRWNLEVAKYRSEKYPVGLAWDPQTWGRITDAQMSMMTTGFGRGERHRLSQLILQWAKLNSGMAFYRDLLLLARNASKRSLLSWELEASWLKKNEPDMTKHLPFWKKWISTFQGDSDTVSRGQKELYRVFQKLGDTKSGDKLMRQIAANNKSGRFDLGISLAAEVVFEQMRLRDWIKAEKEYEAMLTRFKSKAGGHLFYNLVQPYISKLLDEGESERAVKGVALMENYFQVRERTILSNDIEKLRKQVAAMGGK